MKKLSKIVVRSIIYVLRLILPIAPLEELEAFRQLAATRDWHNERLKVMVLDAVTLQANGEKDRAVQVLGDALALVEPGGFIQIFVDEGAPMVQLLSTAAARGIMPDYVGDLLAVFEAEKATGQARPGKSEDKSSLPPALPEEHRDAETLVEPLSVRELEILQLIAQGLSNCEISERLFLALDTIKGHNRMIFDKLRVQRRTEAVARAREFDLL